MPRKKITILLLLAGLAVFPFFRGEAQSVIPGDDISHYPLGTIYHAPDSKTLFRVDGTGGTKTLTAISSMWTLPPHVEIKDGQVNEGIFRHYIEGESSGRETWLTSGKLFRGQNDPTVFFIDAEGGKRPFASASVFNLLGFQSNYINVIPDAMLERNPDGEIINSASFHPAGCLVRATGSSTVYYLLNDNVKQAFISPGVFNLYYGGPSYVMDISPTELDGYVDGGYAQMPEGKLVKSSSGSTIYFIDSEGYKRPFNAFYSFDGLGFRIEDIHIIGNESLGLNPTGEILASF
jgi:hypothetical protein